MARDDSAADPVAALADEFLARYRRGERPAVSEYTDRCPELAERLRQVIPLLVMMEQAGPAASPSPGAAPAGPGVADLLPGRIGGYRVLREVGRGGMGVVYEAEQVALGRHVALKVLPAHLAHQGSGLERFRREARAAARLHHSNIVPVYEVGEDGAYCFYAMQFIRGQGLDKVLEELRSLRDARPGDEGRPARSAALSLLTEAYQGDAPKPAPPPAKTSSVSLPGDADRSAAESGHAAYHRGVARVGVQAAEALDHAHREGVVHRDVKPSNLLLDADGRVWVADFGLAQTDGAALTVTGDVVGTVRYMAPERFRGWSDPRSDVYSLGLTLYEMLLLRPAFASPDRVSLIHQVTHLEPARLRQVEPRIPRDLETVVHKAIDREPGRRYQTAAELAADLRRFLDDRPILARSVGRAERAWRWCRRNPLVAGLVAAVVVVFVGGFAATLWQMGVALANEQTARGNELKANQQVEETRKANERLRDARNQLHHALYIADMNLVQAAYEAENLREARALLDRHRPRAGEPDERGFEWYYWQHLCHAELSNVALAGDLHISATLSPDGTRLACLDFSRPEKEKIVTVRVLDAATGREVASLPCKNELGWDLFRQITSLCFSPDGKRLAVHLATWISARPGTRLVLWEPGSDRGPAIIQDAFLSHSYYTYAFSPDGCRIAAWTDGAVTPEEQKQGVHRYTLKVWECDGGKEVLAVPQTSAVAGPLAFSPDGGRIALMRASQEKPNTTDHRARSLVVLDASTAKPVLDVADAGLAGISLAFSADGKRLLASALTEGTAASSKTEGRIWDAVTGAVLQSVPDLPALHCKIVVSPDGRYLVWYSKMFEGGVLPTVQVRNAADGKVLATLRGHTGSVLGVAFSADGSRLVTAGIDGTVRQWELPEADGNLGQGPCAAPDVRSEIQVRDDRTRKEVLCLRDLHGSFAGLQISPDGKRVAALHQGQIDVWDVEKGKIGLTVKVPLSFSGVPRPNTFWQTVGPELLFRPDGRQVVLSTPQGEASRGLFAIKAWDADSGQEVFATEPAAYVSQLQFTPDGRRLLAVAGEPGEIKVWDAEGKERFAVKTGMTVERLTACRAGTRFAAVLSRPESRLVYLKVWDADTGEERATFPEVVSLGNLPLPNFALSPDGRLLAAGLRDVSHVFGADTLRIKVWDIDAGELLHTIPNRGLTAAALAFSPDGRRLVAAAAPPNTGVDGPHEEIRLWDVATGRQLMGVASPVWLGVFTTKFFEAPTHRPIAFSTDGNKLIARSAPRTTRSVVWDGTPLPDAPKPKAEGGRKIPGWGEVVDPDGDCTLTGEDGKLTITVPGTVHDLNRDIFKDGRGRNAPRVLQAVEGDFIFQAKLSGDFFPGNAAAAPSQVAAHAGGLLLWIDDRSYVRVERGVWVDADGTTTMRTPFVEYWKNGRLDGSVVAISDASLLKDRSFYLRLERRKGEVRARVSADGRSWTDAVAPLNLDLPPAVRVGADAVNTSKKPFTVEFERLTLTRAAPLTPAEPPDDKEETSPARRP
jgi:serine/threonine protein kinase/WD40 repeat protein/regulation of enolase protein 1 (concanavalin A-like superfamily)